MNKKNGIIIGVLSLIVTMMVGYAIFSETITINGTATAKGSFDLTYTCEKDEENSTGTGTCKVEEDTITTTSNFSKPTEVNIYKITVTNSGTIPAVLKTVTSPNNKGQDFKSDGDFAYINDNLLSAYYSIVQNESEYYGDAAVEAANITIEPSETITINIIHGWVDSEILGLEQQPVLPEQGDSITYNLTFGFEQIQAQ